MKPTSSSFAPLPVENLPVLVEYYGSQENGPFDEMLSIGSPPGELHPVSDHGQDKDASSRYSHPACGEMGVAEYR
jgi:hypothetical protein